jgi:hypothetical protein
MTRSKNCADEQTCLVGLHNRSSVHGTDSTDDSPNIEQALSTVRGLQWAPSMSVRPIFTLGSGWDSNLDAARNLESFGCGKWIWRIAEEATESQACPGATWISEILPKGFNTTTTLEERHDARANVSVYRGLS